MGYAAEKEKQEKRILKYKRIVLLCVLLVFLSLCIFSAFVPPDTWKYGFRKPRVGRCEEGELRVHFVDVGQGDCTIIQLPDDKVMLIDGGDGESEHTTAIMRYLNALRVKKIDYLVVTHADKDHCGGLKEIVKRKRIGRAFLPKCDITENAAYASFYTELMEEECSWEYNSRSVNLSMDGDCAYTLRCIYPYTLTVEEGGSSNDDNQLSAVVWLEYKNIGTLFMADVSQSVEAKLVIDDKLSAIEGVDLDTVDVIKVAHHGSANATGEVLLAHATTLQHAVISCGVNNMYGHPSTEVMDRLSRYGVETHRTDLQGSVMMSVKQDGTYSIDNLGK
jgi:competence protein ComEC